MSQAIQDPLAAQAVADPSKIAVIEDDRHLDVAAFDALANRYANTLIDLGVRAGTKVVWCGRNSLEVVALITAARRAGAVAVPLNYRLSPHEASYVIGNCDAEVVLFDIEQHHQLATAADEVGHVRTWAAFRCEPGEAPAWAHHLDRLAAEASDEQPAPVGEHEVAGTAMFYTSGTTGHPKGVVRKPLTGERVRGIVTEIGFQPEDVYLTTGPLYHSGPHAFLQITQQLGGTVVVLRHFEPQRWLELVERHRVTTTFSAPTPIRRVLDLPDDVIAGYDTSSMQRLIANAAPWPFELKRRYVEAFGDESLFEVYGSTELGIDTLLSPSDQLRKPGSCGRPAPGIELALFDEEGRRITEPHVAGDLYVRGPTVLETYYKDQGKLEESRRGGWVTVGDIAYVDEEGYYYICDRRTDMIISGGMNIYPAEIEAVLTSHPAVADVAVFGIPSREWGEQVHATVVLRADDDVDDGELDAHARAHLAAYKVPRTYDRIDEIPRNPSGKVLKRALRDPYWEGHDRRIG